MKKEFIQQQQEISFVKNTFTDQLCKYLDIIEVQGPLLSKVGDGMQDNLSGIETAVQVTVKQAPGYRFEIVHSLAKWKRHTLARFAFKPNEGLFVHMKALRPDEEVLDQTHSIFVDQWDWEKVMPDDCRNLTYLKEAVNKIYAGLLETEAAVCREYPDIKPFLAREIKFIHSEELLQLYPDLSGKEREDVICKKYGSVFIIGIGGKLSNGQTHDLRAPDYDDWITDTENGYKGLNGDILVWNPTLQASFEISSMGIRVNKEALLEQTKLTNTEDRLSQTWHKDLLDGVLPQSIGGGIGRSRVIMLLLGKKHIGEVQSSVWPESVIQAYDGIL